MKQLSGPGCMFLFFMPFAAVGIGTGYQAFSHLNQGIETSSWDKVPANVSSIVSSEKRSGDDGTTKYIKASYTYNYQGEDFEGTKVGVDDEGGLGVVFDAREQSVKDAKKRGEEVYCYVNPENPSEAVLFPGVIWDVLAFWAIFAFLFGGVGIGGMIFVFWALKQEKITKKLQKSYPAQPWKWKEEWLTNVIPARTGFKVGGLWAMAIFWNLLSSPLWVVIPQELKKSNYIVLIGVLFPLVGMVLLYMAIRVLIQHKKFGESKLVLDAVPAVIGGHLKGHVQFASPLRVVEGMNLGLSCKQMVRSGDKKVEKLLWQSDQSIEQKDIGGGHIAGIPVAFTIPYDKKPTDKESQVRWILDISAELPGVDFEADYEVPVFKTEASDPNVKREKQDLKFTSFVEAPDTKIVVTDLPSGKLITAPPLLLRNTKMVVGTLIFTIIWTAMSAGLFFVNEMPLLFKVVFNSVSLLMILITTSMFFKKVELQVDRTGVKKLSQTLLFKSNNFYPLEDIREVKEAITATTQKGGKQQAYYGINLSTKWNKRQNLIRSVNSKKTALYFVNLIRHELGLEDAEGQNEEDGPWVG